MIPQPGLVRDIWFRADKIGTYRGACTELCGRQHAFMPVVVEVVSEQDYSAWVKKQKELLAAKLDDPNKEWQLTELVARGQAIYNGNCAACHQPTGQGVPGNFPALVGSKNVLGAKEPQIEILLNGKGQGMPAWKQLSDVEIASVITYTRNAWGQVSEQNVVQPKEVMAQRK